MRARICCARRQRFVAWVERSETRVRRSDRNCSLSPISLRSIRATASLFAAQEIQRVKAGTEDSVGTFNRLRSQPRASHADPASLEHICETPSPIFRRCRPLHRFHVGGPDRRRRCGAGCERGDCCSRLVTIDAVERDAKGEGHRHDRCQRGQFRLKPLVQPRGQARCGEERRQGDRRACETWKDQKDCPAHLSA
jgi:hypothetical protein